MNSQHNDSCPQQDPATFRLVTTWPIDPRLAPLGSFKDTTEKTFAVAHLPGEQRNKVASFCREIFHEGITLGWCPVEKVKAVFFDMDATVIAEESLVELANLAGHGDAVGRITERAMAGDIDFKEALRERVALIRGLHARTLDRVRDRLTLNPGIREFVDMCRQRHIPTFMVSGGFSCFADHVKELVGFTDVHSNTLEWHGQELTGRVTGEIVDAVGKKTYLEKTCASLGISPKETCAIGDGANDIPMLHTAGVAVGYRPKKALLGHIHAINYEGDHRFLEALLFGA